MLAGCEEPRHGGEQRLLLPPPTSPCLLLVTDAGEVKIVANYLKRGLKRKVLSGINIRHENLFPCQFSMAFGAISIKKMGLGNVRNIMQEKGKTQNLGGRLNVDQDKKMETKTIQISNNLQQFAIK